MHWKRKHNESKTQKKKQKTENKTKNRKQKTNPQICTKDYILKYIVLKTITEEGEQNCYCF